MTIPDELLAPAQTTEAELRQEIAVLLFGQDRLTLAQAARLAEMDRLRFQRFLADRGCSVHDDVEEFEADLVTLREAGRL